MDINTSHLIDRYNLKYVYEEPPGIRRIRRGRGFSYLDDQNKNITNEQCKNRLKSEQIPK